MADVSTPSEKAPVFTAAAGGATTVGTSAAQLAGVAGRLVLFQADHDNTGYVCVGGSDVATGTGLRLAAGEQSPWMPIDNLTRFYAVASASAQKLRHVVLS